MELFKIGETIVWSFAKDDICKDLRGKTFNSEIRAIDDKAECYCVVAEYGQDKIPFDECEKYINICYKSKEPCKYSCDGLCKESC